MSPMFPILIYLIQFMLVSGSLPKEVSRYPRPEFNYTYEQIGTILKDQDERGYNIYYPVSDVVIESPIVLFIHGYGAINPMIFGEWISHLVRQGNVVIYPRYQKNLLSPSTEEFTPLVSEAYRNALEDLKSIPNIRISDDHFIVGHSYGGVITANIALKYKELNLPKPSAIFSCEPGHGPLTGGVEPDYSAMDISIPMVVLVGDDDWTVGDEFGKRLYYETNIAQPKFLLRQIAARYDTFSITASHYEPYAIHENFDNGHRNITFSRAMKMGKLDAVDFHAYWKILDHMIISQSEKIGSGMEFTQPWSLGCWPGTDKPIDVIEIEDHSLRPRN